MLLLENCACAGCEVSNLVVDNSTHITGVGVERGIDVKASGDGVETLDSEIRHITVTKPDAPTVEAVAGGFESAVSDLQYSADDGTTWLAADPVIGGGSKKTGLAPGAYSVRVKPNGTQLASDSIPVVVEGPEPVVIAGVDMATTPKLSATAKKIAKANTDKADVAGSAFLPLRPSATGGSKQVTAKKSKLAVKKGKTVKLNASVKSTKKYAVHIAKLRYESADSTIATVNKKGKVTGKKKGKVKVYACAQNGKYKAVTVTVK